MRTGDPSLLALARDVDATKFRACLDSIRAALNSTARLTAAPSVSLYGNKRLSLSLNLVLEALARSDAIDRSSTAALPPVLGGVEQLQRLREMLLALQPSWMSLVVSKLCKAKVAALRSVGDEGGEKRAGN